MGISNINKNGSDYAQVAVSNDGDVFVADGYCNARVMHFAADGSFVQQIALPRVHILTYISL